MRYLCLVARRYGVAILLPLCLLFGPSARAQKANTPAFGKGETEVRLYTDYFCAPCSRMEPKIEGLLSDLVKKNAIKLIFVDTPVHKMTPLYAKYFIFIVDADRSFPNILRSRAVLFDAAKNKIVEKEGLEEFLAKNRVKFRETDPRPTLLALSALINEDNIKSTPTAVIIRDGNKGVFTGEAEIMKALELLD